MDRLVAVAVYEHHLARLEKRHQHRLVGGRSAVRHIPAKRAAEDFGRHLLRLGKRRLHLGAREIAKRLDRHRKIGPEDHRAERLVETAQERRGREGVAAVVPGSVPVGARLDLHVLAHRAPEARQPERLEEMDDPLVVDGRVCKHLRALLRPSPLRHDHWRVPGIGHDDLWYRGQIRLKPVLQQDAADGPGIQGVVDHEQADVVATFGHSPRRIAVDEQRVGKRIGRRNRRKLERRVLEGHADVERLGAEVAERVGHPVLHDGKMPRVVFARSVQPYYG